MNAQCVIGSAILLILGIAALVVTADRGPH
jgi:hypothetical protein